MSKRPIRVALGSVYPYDESRIGGGVEAAAVYLAGALAQREDVELHVVSLTRRVARDLYERRGPIVFHWLPVAPRLQALKSVSEHAARVRAVYRRSRPDIVHAEGFSEYAVGTPPGTPLILTVHGLEVFAPIVRRFAHFAGPAGLYRRFLVRWLARASLRPAQGVISTAGPYIEEALGRAVAGKQIFCIDNPIGAAFFAVPDLPPEGPPVVLSASAIYDL